MKHDLTDIQWCFLDLLARAKAKGAPRVNRSELLYTDALPANMRAGLVFAGLTMSRELVAMHNNEREFSITEKGEALIKFRFGKASSIADHVICLPDRSAERIQ